MKNVSIVVATKNRGYLIQRSIEGMLAQTYPGKFEVVIANDGSTDNTTGILDDIEAKSKGMVTVIHIKNSRGPAFARNRAIEKTKYPVVVVMDDDCIPKKNWLKNLIEPIGKNNVGITTSYSMHGGTSTAYLKSALDKVGNFDESYEFPHREDTDLVFRIQDLGLDVLFVNNAPFIHEHKMPTRLSGKVKYGFRRIWIHHADCLLYKKHPKRSKKFLGIEHGFLINPKKDFRTATGMWHKDIVMGLSSPQGLTFVENKTVAHTIAIIAIALGYVGLIKAVRLFGSLKYRKLLI